MSITRNGYRCCYGALVRKDGSILDLIDRLLIAGVDLRLLTEKEALSVWGGLWRGPHNEYAFVNALNRIETMLTGYAAPGYTFQPCFTKDGTFWGWFPRTG
jgi:hypothetical protein